MFETYLGCPHMQTQLPRDVLMLSLCHMGAIVDNRLSTIRNESFVQKARFTPADHIQ